MFSLSTFFGVSDSANSTGSSVGYISGDGSRDFGSFSVPPFNNIRTGYATITPTYGSAQARISRSQLAELRIPKHDCQALPFRLRSTSFHARPSLPNSTTAPIIPNNPTSNPRLFNAIPSFLRFSVFRVSFPFRLPRPSSSPASYVSSPPEVDLLRQPRGPGRRLPSSSSASVPDSEYFWDGVGA